MSFAWIQENRSTLGRSASLLLSLGIIILKIDDVLKDSEPAYFAIATLLIGFILTILLLYNDYKILDSTADHSSEKLYRLLVNKSFNEGIKIFAPIIPNGRITIYYVGTDPGTNHRKYYFPLGRVGPVYPELKASKNLIIEQTNLVLHEAYLKTSSSNFHEIDLSDSIERIKKCQKKWWIFSHDDSSAWMYYWRQKKIKSDFLNKTRMRPKWYLGFRIYEKSVLAIALIESIDPPSSDEKEKIKTILKTFKAKNTSLSHLLKQIK